MLNLETQTTMDTGHRTNKTKTKHNKQKQWDKRTQTKQPGVNPGALEENAVPVSYKIPDVLLI